MELVRIFVEESSMEGLYSIQYDDQNISEYDRVLDNLFDDEYLLNYLTANIDYIESSIYKHFTIDQLFDQIRAETENIETWLNNYSQNEFKETGKNLQMIFKPYSDVEPILETQQKSKAKVINLPIKNPLVRLYAIKITTNTFVITGGAIKFMYKMAEHPDTVEEDKKLKLSMDFIKSKSLTCEEDIIYYYDNN